jgi:hypothetical protein
MSALLRVCAAAILSLAASGVFADFHLFRIEQLFSNADGTVQFIVLHEIQGDNGEHVWSGHTLTTQGAQGTRSFTFPSNLPSFATANKRVLVATQSFAALNLVTPNYTVPDGFLPLGNGTVNYAGVDQVIYPSLPNDGTSAINASGTLPGRVATMVIPNVATNFAGAQGSVTAGAPVAIVPRAGIWWNPDESGTGYIFDVRNGTLVITIFTYEAGTGHSEWYLSSGPLTDNGTRYVGPLDKYRNGQCISCAYVLPTPIGSDGTITVTFTSATSATLSLPGNRTTNIVPLLGP